MAGRILDVQFPEVNPSGATSARGFNIHASPEAFGSVGAEVAKAFGGAVEKAADTGLDAMTARQHLTNEVHASEVNTWLADQITDRHTKYATLEGRAAMDALPQYKTDIEDLYHQSMEQAVSPDEKAILAKTGRAITTRYYGLATQHADGQFRTWADKTAERRAATYGNQAAIMAANGDDAAMEQSLHTSDDEVAKLYEQKGWDRDAIDAEVRKNRGKNLKSIIEMRADQDPVGASALYRKFESQMDAASSVAVLSKLRTQLSQIKGRDVADEETGHKAPQASEVAGVPASFVSAIKRTEGFAPSAKWDYKQHTNGYGTRANAPDEKIDRAEADRRFDTEVGKAAKFVDSINPNLDPGTRAALTSLTFNAGQDWAKSGLGEKVRAGDIEGAKQSFLQYNRAGGDVNQGLVTRRYREAQWFGQGEAPAGGMQLADKTEAYERVLSRTDGNPLVQSAAITRLNQVYALAKTETTQANASFDRSLKDSYAEIGATGHAMQPLTEAQFVQRYGVDQGLQRYEDYTGELAAAADDRSLQEMKPQEQQATLERLVPVPGVPGYAAHLKRFEAAQTAVEKIAKLRTEDPAGSVAKDETVRAAAKAVDPNDPSTTQALAAARLAAQEQAGIPEDNRSPITKNEALALAEPLRRALPGQERGALQAVAENAQKLYGPYAEDAFQYALRAQRFDAETTKMAARVLKKLSTGADPSRAENVAADRAGDIGAADNAVRGDFEGDFFNPSTPPAKNENFAGQIPANAIRALRGDASKAADFDRKYGAGASKKILDGYPVH